MWCNNGNKQFPLLHNSDPHPCMLPTPLGKPWQTDRCRQCIVFFAHDRAWRTLKTKKTLVTVRNRPPFICQSQASGFVYKHIWVTSITLCTRNSEPEVPGNISSLWPFLTYYQSQQIKPELGIKHILKTKPKLYLISYVITFLVQQWHSSCVGEYLLLMLAAYSG
jgi:hypothetical protein